MDWKGCNKKSFVKQAKPDENLLRSLKEISDDKIKASNTLTEELIHPKITLLYDGLRELLEIIALKKGYKIYNHECYTSFLKEIIKESELGDSFDKFKVLRNKINYYGKKITTEEAKTVINEMKEFIEAIKRFL